MAIALVSFVFAPNASGKEVFGKCGAVSVRGLPYFKELHDDAGEFNVHASV